VDPVFFAAPAEFRAWLEAHHASETELLVGFHKKGTGMPSLTWPQSVDEALCFGWIDGVRRSLGAESYTIRFTPRKARSFWSNVNIRRAGELIAEGRMTPAGLRAFEARTGERSGVYSFEQKDKDAVVLPPEMEARFRANAEAWEYFQSRPPWYRQTSTWWVISAKKEETREKRIATLIADSAARRPIRGLDRKNERGGG
jgi:uncharacterized protein YdeI (YjbR/CyaY-like superfamily)